MGDQREAQLSAMENIQEKFRHNIQEMEGQSAKLTSLFEDMAVHPQGPSPLPNQWVLQTFIQNTSHLPRGTDSPNLRQSMFTTSPTKGKPSGQKAARRKKTNGIQSPSLMLSCFQS